MTLRERWRRYEGLFEDWTFSRSYAFSPGGESCLFVYHGLWDLEDVALDVDGNQYVPFVAGLGRWARLRIWRELKREQQRRRDAEGRTVAEAAAAQRAKALARLSAKRQTVAAPLPTRGITLRRKP